MGGGRVPSKWGGSELCPFTPGPGSSMLPAPIARLWDLRQGSSLAGPRAGLWLSQEVPTQHEGGDVESELAQGQPFRWTDIGGLWSKMG